jgi:hypothetical protein
MIAMRFEDSLAISITAVTSWSNTNNVTSWIPEGRLASRPIYLLYDQGLTKR